MKKLFTKTMIVIGLLAGMSMQAQAGWFKQAQNMWFTGHARFEHDVDVTGTLKLNGTSISTDSTLGNTNVSVIANEISLKNDETIDNATDGEVRVTFDDDAATLGTLALESDNAVANIADNDLFKISATAYDSATNKQEYLSVDLKATDVTTATEDSQFVFNYMAGGAAKTATLGATSAGAESFTLTTADFQATAGTIYSGVGFDGVGAVDLDYGSADITDHTFISDGGTVVIDGSVTVPLDINANGNIVGDDATVITNISTIYCDTIEEDGTGGVAIEGFTLNDNVLTMSNGEMLDNTTADGHVMLYGDADESIIFEVRSPNTSDGDAEIRLVTDAMQDNADGWRILNDADGSNLLTFDNYTSGAFVSKFSVSTAGAGTFASTVDATGYTSDAGAGIDVQSAGALKVGVTTATSVDYGSASATAHTFVTDGTGDAEVVLPANSIGDAEVTDAPTLSGATFSGLSLCTYGIGAPVAGVASAVEYGDGINHQTIITLTNVSLAIADGAFDDGEKVYDFPEGRILIEGVTANLISTITANFNASAADTFVVAAGTTTTSVSGDGTLQTTEVDLLPSTENDTASGTVTVFTNGIALAASAQFDGTTTAKDVFVNMGIPAANDSGDNTNAVTGTITITWKNLGDY